MPIPDARIVARPEPVVRREPAAHAEPVVRHDPAVRHEPAAHAEPVVRHESAEVRSTPVAAAEEPVDAPAGAVLTGMRPAPTADNHEGEHLRPALTVARPSAGANRRPEPASFAVSEGADGGARPTCTAAQLRRFIKSRPWVPMHELRRRFGIIGTEDDVTLIRVADQHLYVGLPPAEGRMMAELLAGGDVGYELSLDPVVPIVVGVYPMRPVPRS